MSNSKTEVSIVTVVVVFVGVLISAGAIGGGSQSPIIVRYFEEGSGTSYPADGMCRDVCRQLGFLKCSNLRAGVCESDARVSWNATEPIKTPSDFFIVGGTCRTSQADKFGKCFDSHLCLPDDSKLDLKRDFSCNFSGEKPVGQFVEEKQREIGNTTVRMKFQDRSTSMTCKVEVYVGPGDVWKSEDKVPLWYLRCLNTWDCRAKYGSLYRDDWSEFMRLANLTPRATSVRNANQPGIYFCRSDNKWNLTLFTEVSPNLEFLRFESSSVDRNSKRNSKVVDKFNAQYFFSKSQAENLTTFQCQASSMMYMSRFLWTLKPGRGLQQVQRFGQAETINYKTGVIESNLTVPTSHLGPEYFVKCSIIRRDSVGLLEISTPIISVSEAAVELNLTQKTPVAVKCSVQSHPNCQEPPKWGFLQSEGCNESKPLQQKQPEIDGQIDRCSSTLYLGSTEIGFRNCTLTCTSSSHMQEAVWGMRSAQTAVNVFGEFPTEMLEPTHLGAMQVLLIVILFTTFFGSIIVTLYRRLKRMTPPLSFTDISRYLQNGAVPQHFRNFDTLVERIQVDPIRNFLWDLIKLDDTIMGSGFFGVVNAAILQVPVVQNLQGRLCIQLGSVFVEVSSEDVVDGKLHCCVKRLKRITGKGWREMLYDVSLIFTVMESEERWKNRIVEYFGYHMCDHCTHAGIVMRRYQGSLEKYILRMRNAYVMNAELANRQMAANTGYYVRQGVVLTDADLVKILIDVAKGMVCLKNLNIVHGDLKPDNIFVIPASDRVKVFIGDFGQAKIYDPDQALIDDQRHIDLRPPEDLNGRTPSEKTDVWAFGLLAMHLFDLCNHTLDPYRGQAPAQGKYENMGHYLERHLVYLNQGNRAEITPNTPSGVRELITWCWQTRPEDRPGFDEILANLREILLEVSVPI